MKQLLTIIAFAISILSFSQKIEGQIITSTKTELSDIEIVITKDKTKENAFTDQVGKVNLNIKNDGNNQLFKHRGRRCLNTTR